MSILSKPLRRVNLLVETVAGEVLIYDETSHKAFCLNPLASVIWDHCDGASSPQQITSAVATTLNMVITEDVVLSAIEEFRRDKLIESMPELLPTAILSRREMAMKLGIGVAMAMPVIATIVAPKAAQAYNGCVDC